VSAYFFTGALLKASALQSVIRKAKFRFRVSK
jgi:hypothetical protein